MLRDNGAVLHFARDFEEAHFDALAAAERRRSAVWTRKRLREPHGVTIRKSDTNGRAPNLIGWTDFEGEGLLRETKAR